jgi:hypothetical protein
MLNGSKNCIGNFFSPKLTVCDTEFLLTLPPRDIQMGLVEIIKHSVVASEDYYSYLDSVIQPAIENWENYPWDAYTFTHEIAHHLTSIWGDIFLQYEWNYLENSYKEDVWDGSVTNPETGPTDYARTADWVGEDQAESITTYVLNRQEDFWSSQFPYYWIDNFYPSTKDLDSTRTQWIENFFGAIREMYP